MKTRDEFLRYHAPLAKNPDTGKLRYEPDFARDLDALLAAARAEALESVIALAAKYAKDYREADDDDRGIYENRLVADGIDNLANGIRALVKP